MFTNQCILENVRDLQTDFFFPLEYTPMTGFSEVISITYDFRKIFKHTHYVGRPSLHCLHHYHYYCLLHFTLYEVFIFCDITQPEFPPYWQFFHCFPCFPPFWNNSALITDIEMLYLWAETKEQLWIQTTVLNLHLYWLNRCLLSRGIPQQGKVSNSSACWTSEYFVCYLPAGHNSNVTNIGVPTDQHHTAQWWQNCWGHQQTCSSRPPVFVDSWH